MDFSQVQSQKENFYLKLSGAGRGGIILCILAGVGTLAAGLSMGMEKRTWGAYLFNILFFYSIALGGVVLGSIQDAVSAHWGRPIRRIHEAFGAFLGAGSVALIVFLLAIKFRLAGAGDVYSWIADPHMLDHFPGKNVWLQENFMIIRDILMILAIWYMSHRHLALGIKRDQAFAAGRAEEARELAKHAYNRQRYFSGPFLFVLATLFTFLHFDVTMSLAPTWFSTLWGGWAFALLMQTLLAFIMIMMFWLKGTKLGEVYKKQQFHDVGKLMFGFTCFFAYLTFAHVLTYWYGNVPEETEYFLHRLHAPWVYIVASAPLTVFLIPLFAFIPKAAKWTGAVAVPVSLLVLVAQWATYMVVVMPQVTDKIGFPWVEFGLFFGFLGLFLMGFYRFAAKVPMVPVADPLLEDALSSHH